MIKDEQCQHDNYSSQEFNDHNTRISIFIRFLPKMKNRGMLQNILADCANEAEVELLNQFPEEMVKPVIEKLRNVMKAIKNEPQQRLAIFVSPISEKVIYFTYNPYLEEFNKLHPLVTLI